MTDKLTFKLEGFKEFEDQIKELSATYKNPNAITSNVLVRAVKKALIPAKDNIKSSLPYAEHITPSSRANKDGIEKPHLNSTVKVHARIPNGLDMRSNFVHDGDVVIGIVSVKKSAVSLAMEFGTATVGANPILSTKFYSSSESVLNALKSELSYIIPAYAKKLNKRGVK